MTNNNLPNVPTTFLSDTIHGVNKIRALLLSKIVKNKNKKKTHIVVKSLCYPCSTQNLKFKIFTHLLPAQKIKIKTNLFKNYITYREC